MSRLDRRDPNKRETPLTPGPDQILAGREPSVGSYSKRVRDKKVAVSSLKGKGKPLGGAPPIESGKVGSLVGGMAQPNFDDEEPEAGRPPVEPPTGGVGSAYGFNHAISGGATDGPATLAEAKKAAAEQAAAATGTAKSLSEESIEALKNVEVDEGEELDPERKLDEVEEKLVERESFDFDSISKERNALMSKDRRVAIESRLKPLNIEDLILSREISQTIPVIQGKLMYTLRTYSQQEYMACLQRVFDNPGSGLYAEELLNISKLTCSLVAINGVPLPDHRKNVGQSNEEVDQTLFQKKLARVSAFPVQLIADISVQTIWFNERVNDLFSLDNLKNG